MEPDRLDDLAADGVDRVERGHRLLEDHRDLVARGSIASRARSSLSRSCPLKSTSPDSMLPGGDGMSRMMESDGHALAAPDSPTMPTVLPLGTSNETPSTARKTPASVRNDVTRLRTASRFGNCPRGEGIRHRMYTSSLGPCPPEIPVE